jgi:transposase
MSTTNCLVKSWQTSAAHFQVGKKKRIALVVDRAAWHTSGQVQVPEGIDLIFLPAYSPELQPAERLWTLTNESVANRSFKNLDELEEVLMYRCRQLLKRPELIQGLTRYHWWPLAAA